MIDKARYTDPDIALLERERLWSRAWIIAAHAGELEAPGAFVTYPLGDQSLIVSRQADGTVRAFHNVCLHRGARLCDKLSGRTESFRCPYHHWEWRADGSLADVPELHSFSPESIAELRLSEVACAEREGFVWISFDPEPSSIDEFLAPLLPWLRALGSTRWQVAGQTRSRVAANWKAVFDVHNEALHLPFVHPQATAFVDISGFRFDALGHHGIIRIPFAAPDPHRHPGDALNEGLRQLLQLHGLDPASVPNRQAARAAIYGAVADAARAQALDVDFVGADAIADVIQLDVFPNAMILVQLGSGNVSLNRFTPDPACPANPGRAVCDVTSFDWTGSLPPDRRIPRREGDSAAEGGGAETKQDFAMLERLQRGLASQGFVAAVPSRYEAAIVHIHAQLDVWMGIGADGACGGGG